MNWIKKLKREHTTKKQMIKCAERFTKCNTLRVKGIFLYINKKELFINVAIIGLNMLLDWNESKSTL